MKYFSVILEFYEKKSLQYVWGIYEKTNPFRVLRGPWALWTGPFICSLGFGYYKFARKWSFGRHGGSVRTRGESPAEKVISGGVDMVAFRVSSVDPLFPPRLSPPLLDLVALLRLIDSRGLLHGSDALFGVLDPTISSLMLAFLIPVELHGSDKYSFF